MRIVMTVMAFCGFVLLGAAIFRIGHHQSPAGYLSFAAVLLIFPAIFANRKQH